ncbi:IS66 family transposase [Bradyrhizobium canariense]|uniref:IS66 family transposase n=1 Tax=Bradyrhizobium canariense TaxID=255045 RepID=UPI003D9BE283
MPGARSSPGRILRRTRSAPGTKEIVISPAAMEIVRRINALFEIKRSINDQNADQRKAVRQAQSAPRVADLEAYMREQCCQSSPAVTIWPRP